MEKLKHTTSNDTQGKPLSDEEGPPFTEADIDALLNDEQFTILEAHAILASQEFSHNGPEWWIV